MSDEFARKCSIRKVASVFPWYLKSLMRYIYFTAFGLIWRRATTKWHYFLWNWMVFKFVPLLLDQRGYFCSCYCSVSHINVIIFFHVVNDVFGSIGLFLFILQPLLLDKLIYVWPFLFVVWYRFCPFNCIYVSKNGLFLSL